MKQLLTGIVFVVAAGLVIWLGVRYGERLGSAPAQSQPTTTVSMQNELQIEDVRQGTGAEAKRGDRVTVHYVGTLSNGTEFDSSRRRGQPFTFALGAGQVIAGWDQGVAGMKVGGIRKLTIPPELAYGDAAVGSIPANSTLQFEVELLGVQ